MGVLDRVGAGYSQLMDNGVIIAILRRHEAELRPRGARRLAVFGSTARSSAINVDTLTDDLDPPERACVTAMAGLPADAD
jgi:hypothetical protein